MAMKMPAKSFATSLIGPQEKPFSAPARLRRQLQGRDGHGDHDEIAQGVGELDLRTEQGHAAEIDGGAHEDGGDDDEDQKEVDAARDAHRIVGGRIGADAALLPVDDEIDREEEGEQEHAGRRRWPGSRCVVVQKKSTPRRNPRKSGGSPSGVSEPPIFDTRKMKNTITWTLCRRSSLARMIGRIITMDAPVVPMRLASTVPIASRTVLAPGAPWMLPRTRMPPATVNRASSRALHCVSN